MTTDAAPPDRRRGRPGAWQGYAAAVAAVAVATAADAALYRWSARSGPPGELSNLVLVELLAVVWTAGRAGWGPAILASVLAVASFDFFFVPPRFRASVADTPYLLTLAVMLAVAAVTSTLTDRVRAGAELARRRERRAAALLGLTRALASPRDVPSVAAAAAGRAAEVFDAAVLVLGPDGDGLATVASVGGWAMGAVERSAAASAFRHGHTATAGPAAFLPLASPRGTVGVLAVRMAASVAPMADADQVELLEAFAAGTAAAVDRARLADDARSAWERVEAEFLRNTLLSSVSHDLRTPLAAIAGAAETMLANPLDDRVRTDLTTTVLDEARRMERLVTNLLDVTRLESGGLHLRREWQPVGELVGAALHRLRHRLGGRPVSVRVPSEVPMVRVDAVSFEQVLCNLLDNAAEYTPPGTAVDVSAAVGAPAAWAPAAAAAAPTWGGVTITVADRGPGVPAGTEGQVFQKFFRAHGSGGGRRGIGLGLAICRGIVEAHGGSIVATQRDGGGAAFVIALPPEPGPGFEDEGPPASAAVGTPGPPPNDS